jgi:NAD(P)H-nitrite reductase large subunit
VEVVEGERAVEAVVLSNGHKLPADLILLAIGTDPATDWLTTSGLPTQGGIPTDQYLQTEIDSIWAAGDVALFDDTLLGAVHRLGNWDNASAQGQIAGENMALATPKAFELLSAYSISFFGTNISFVGDVHHHAKMTAVPRGSARSGAYGRLLLHHDRLVGATLINRFAERGAIDKIIRSQRTLRQQDILDLTDETVPLRQVATRLAA